MPVYIWKNEKGEKVEVVRSFDEYNVPPTIKEGGKAKEWTKVMTAPSVPFEHLRDRGVFAR